MQKDILACLFAADNGCLYCRWCNTPLSEALRFQYPRIAMYLKDFIKKNPAQGVDTMNNHFGGEGDGKSFKDGTLLDIRYFTKSIIL